MTLRELLDKATPGPWVWRGNRKLGMFLATPRGGTRYVMTFRRQGMRGAQPEFQVYSDRTDEEPWKWVGLMTPASELAVLEVPYREDIVDIDHPDARLIALAPVMAALLNDMAEEMKRIEWGSENEWCSSCRSHEWDGHAKSCPLAALLARYGSLGEEA